MKLYSKKNSKNVRRLKDCGIGIRIMQLRKRKDDGTNVLYGKP